jgi:hypothetical protein
MEDQLYEKARRRVARKKRLFKDLVGFVSTSVFLLFINLMFSPGYLWAMWPIGFYAISIIITYLDLIRETFEEDWEEKALTREYHRLKEKKNSTHPEAEDLLDLDEIKEKSPRWNDQDFV